MSLSHHPGVRYTMEHYYVDDYGVRGRPHICFGDAINDHNFDIVWVCSQNSCETPDKSWSDLKSLFPGQYLPPMRPRP